MVYLYCQAVGERALQLSQVRTIYFGCQLSVGVRVTEECSKLLITWISGGCVEEWRIPSVQL